MNVDTIYYKQVQLLVRVLPLIATEDCFALKGGTAINLFVRNMPRLSVDIDLVYLPMDDRKSALEKIRAALTRISQLIEKAIPQAHVQNAHEQSNALRLIVEQKGVRIKIELSPVIRGTVFGEKILPITKMAAEHFGYVEFPVVSLPDLYAGKIAAALDRQHPRDLYDVKFLFENEGFTDDFRKTFLVYLISHQRPMAELLKPNFKELKEVYENEFVQMTAHKITLEELIETRKRLVEIIHETMTSEEKQFLLSFKSLKPDWTLLGLENVEAISQLPSVRWKIINLEKLDGKKRKEAFDKLKKILRID
ncbi:MAG: nucleotidyl transferase AbiEii/AbiGii toxin family protein [Chitinophagaceae bacterium]|nr:nucleotidyl transferase AbiEii/AbiGii toxin family protein [Chitinophagaceae bacterium]